MANEANSELRYLALELTKMSKKNKIPFEKIAKEYVQNVFKLEKIIIESSKRFEKKKIQQLNKNKSKNQLD
ncbi:MAG: hypothetical protein N3D10_02195 [Candidatus Micrarchaeota archaeon]|nr:hypothetical protein [Candidatus Micrarchaeota archaeon]